MQNQKSNFQQPNKTLETIAVDLTHQGVARLSPLELLDDNVHFIDKNFLIDYLTVLNNLASNLDIHTIIWSPERNCVHRGLDWKQIDSAQDILELSNLLHKIVTISGMMSQNIIIDLASGAQDIAAEWSLSADWRLIDRRGHLIFDHARKGLSLMGGASVYLQNHHPVRYWLLNAKAIEASTLLTMGIVNDVYNNDSEREETFTTHLEQHSLLSGMARIQIKQALVASDQQTLEQRLAYERSILRATISTQDWQRFKNGGVGNYISPSEVQSQVRRNRERENEV